eukprot:TRINITY_DN2553_c0_g1_i1.p2 TRINITY_DN2553_c0_g1~~TRINITY_DN2553_c0_g1_i1.p2  ORF type:complete len:220 (-),score=-11.35 TRINITY_DN2553_c0_g1_i1:472-1131(-)
MNVHGFLILGILVCTTLAVAGCTTAPAAPVTPTHSPAISLPSLAIDRNDLAEGYVLTMSKEKNATDVSDLARTLGWKGGYVVQYTKTTAPKNVLLHSLATYPESSMPDVIEYINRTDRSYTDLSYFDISVPGLGKNSRAFVGYPQNQGQLPTVTPTSAIGSIASTGLSMQGTTENVYGENFIEIIFANGTTLEVIRMSGTPLDDEEVIAIAQKAYSKIP